MAESNPAPSPAASSSTSSSPASAGATYKAPTPTKPPNPVLKMMGLPNLPRKLPSRNWMIFWAVTGSITAAVVYDKREKNRATAKWRRAVAHLAEQPIGPAGQMPRKLTIYLEAPPGDGLRTAQDHFIEYAKPVLSASGLDWEFVQGRQQGDVRAAVAEKIRRERRATERPGEEVAPTDETVVENIRKKMGVPQYDGVKGDLVFGLHAWKEYVRGLHEGWLGPLDAPPQPQPEVPAAPADDASKEDDKKDGEEEQKPERPPQPVPYNSPDDYALASLPLQIPAEFSPANPIEFPHRLGFRHTFVRLARFFNRRKLADDIGRDVAAVVLANASREWRDGADGQCEQQQVLSQEEHDWPKSVWKDEEAEAAAAKSEGTDDKDAAAAAVALAPPKEKIWTSPLVVDARLGQRMRRFELSPEDESRAAAVVVPEEEIEGGLKGGLRSLWRWGAESWNHKPMRPNVGNVDDE